MRKFINFQGIIMNKLNVVYTTVISNKGLRQSLKIKGRINTCISEIICLPALLV